MGKEFSSIEDAIEDVRQGKMIVIVDGDATKNNVIKELAAYTPELLLTPILKIKI